jgi:hypothetical protein
MFASSLIGKYSAFQTMSSAPKKFKYSIKVSATEAETRSFASNWRNILQYEASKEPMSSLETYRLPSFSVDNVYRLTSEEKTLSQEQRRDIALLQKGIPFLEPFLAKAIDKEHAKMLRSNFVLEEQYPEHAGHFVVKSDGTSAHIRCTHCNFRLNRFNPSTLVLHACCECINVFLDSEMCPRCCINWTHLGYDDVSLVHYSRCQYDVDFNEHIDFMIAYGDYVESQPAPKCRVEYGISKNGFENSSVFTKSECTKKYRWVFRQLQRTVYGPRQYRVIDAINYIQGKLRYPKNPYPLITIGEEIPEEVVSTPS